MRPVLKVTTRKEGDKNQIFTNISYDKNSLSIFFKTVKRQIKMTLNKTYDKASTCTSLERNMDFYSMWPANQSARKRAKGQSSRNTVTFVTELTSHLLKTLCIN